MNQVFMDLIQTESLVYPIFIALAVLTLGVMAIGYFWVTRKQDSQEMAYDTVNDEQEAKLQSEEDEYRLTSFAKTGDLPEAMNSLNRGSEASSSHSNRMLVRNTPYSDMAAKYGFEVYRHDAKNQFILFDTYYPALSPMRRVFHLDTVRVVTTKGEKLREIFRSRRRALDTYAAKNGQTVIKRRAGKPVKGVSTHG